MTCLTIRAVHFEVVSSIDTSSCVMGIGRFVSCRGFPSVLWSDKGTHLITSDKSFLRNIHYWNERVLVEPLFKKILSKFNPPSLPHHGGSWIRSVRNFKHVLYVTIAKRRLIDPKLNTTFCLIEQSLNAGRLIAASSSSTVVEALTLKRLL